MFQKAGDGFRIVRRSDQKWEGLSTDLVVEQVLMRSMKMSGGLTRGRSRDDGGTAASRTPFDASLC